MQIPETPATIDQLDLMRRLTEYADGTATWRTDGASIGAQTRQACRTLHSALVELVDKAFAPLLDRSTAREMETFTMHDRRHGLKVAHLMWYILDQPRREQLTPPEIGLLVAAAHLHDLGMALSPDERATRLAPESDLWDVLDVHEAQRAAIDDLRAQTSDPQTSEPLRQRAMRNLIQAEEALLARDTRERHATPERYREILDTLSRLHQADPVKIPNAVAGLAFEGDSFVAKLVEICVSHNQEAPALVQRDVEHYDRPRFPRDYPVGSTTADLHLVAAALRLADILDFDRERTPAVLFHYLLPSRMDPDRNRSVLEWGKHLAISSWHLDPDAIVFRGRCTSHVIHHAIVQFCAVIAEEIAATRATFGGLGEGSWPFMLPTIIKADIHEDGYRYVPYRFELDDDRIYELLMGGAIYDDPLVAVRELVQNAVDACMLRDALTRLHTPYMQPGTTNRIFIRYHEPTAECPLPRLTVEDTGTGMDAMVLERYFLKVGRSFYRSDEFNKIRVELRRGDLDFAPVSEFGIGFLSCFLLADQLTVETAPFDAMRGDTRKRTLEINGPTRLIRLDERENTGPRRFTGTRIMLYLTRGSKENKDTAPPTWAEVKAYLEDVCQDLPYRLDLEHVVDGQVMKDVIDPLPLRVELPPEVEPFAFRIPVNDRESGLEGEIVLINWYLLREQENMRSKQRSSISITEEERGGGFSPVRPDRMGEVSVLLRGGFKVGDVPGVEVYRYRDWQSTPIAARLRLGWGGNRNRRYVVTNLARNAATEQQRLLVDVERIWLSYLLEHVDELPAYIVISRRIVSIQSHTWLKHYNAFILYKLARQGWIGNRYSEEANEQAIASWEAGEGPPLFIHNSGHLSILFFRRTLPHVTTFKVGQGGYYVQPPISGWREMLQQSYDVLSDPVGTVLFTEFASQIDHLLTHTEVPGWQFNVRFQDRFGSFNTEELNWLFTVLLKLVHLRVNDEQATLTPQEATLFHRARAVAGDLEVGVGDDSYRIDSFEVPEP